MDEVEAAVRAQMRRVSRELEAMRFRLQGAAWNLLGTFLPGEGARLGEGSASFVVHACAAIECTIADCLIPARRSLQAAARYVPEEENDPSLAPGESLPHPPASEPEEPK